MVDQRVNFVPGADMRHALRRLIEIAMLILAFSALTIIVALSIDRLHEPGYDFRYFWLAGRMWLDGLSPYGPAFPEAGARLVTEGHVPVIWPYPPNFWLPSVWLGFFGIDTAWRIWLVLQAAAMIATSAALAFGMPVHRLPGSEIAGSPLSRTGFFGLHLAIVASSEAAFVSTHPGQFTYFLALGAALVVVGLIRGRTALVVVGVTILLMKPQIGLVVASGLMASGGRAARAALAAGAASVLLVLPAMLIDPWAIPNWLQTVRGYDDAALANLPVAMTGLRNLLWVFGGVAIGNAASMVVALAAGAAVARVLNPTARVSGQPTAERDADMVLAMLAVVLFLSPLHIYDFLIAAVALLGLAGGRGPLAAAGLIAGAMLYWPSWFYLSLSGASPHSIFSGSTFATLGAAALLLMLVARARASLRQGLPKA